MDLKTIELLAAILFTLIALVGGGFIVKEIQLPSVPTWARVVSGLLGAFFLFVFFFGGELSSPKGRVITGGEAPSPKGAGIIYSYKDSAISPHGLKLLDLTARCSHNPPQVNDSLEVEFTLQNATKKPVNLLGTFVVGRDSQGNNRDFGHGNENKTLQPNDPLKTKGTIIVDAPGVWKFGPGYEMGKEIYPGEWQRFPVKVMP